MEIIQAHPEGIRHGDLVAEIHGALPRMDPNIVSGLIYDLNRICPDLIYKPGRDVYWHVSFREKDEEELSEEEGTVQEDLSRLDALCLIFGIGLVLFDNQNPKEPKFDIRVRPLKHEPDMFYVNKYMRLVEIELWR